MTLSEVVVIVIEVSEVVITRNTAVTSVLLGSLQYSKCNRWYYDYKAERTL